MPPDAIFVGENRSADLQIRASADNRSAAAPASQGDLFVSR
jgi:hypothetical protein